MDVEMQVESNGPLNDFGKTPEQQGQTDIPSSLVGAISSTETAAAISKDVNETVTNESATPNGIHHTQDTKNTNGVAEPSPSVPAEPIAKSLPDQADLKPSPASFNDSGIPSSPVQAEPDVMESESTHATVISKVEPTSTPAAPTSNVESAPESAPTSDNLNSTQAQVAVVETEATKEHNVVDMSAASETATAPAEAAAEAPASLVTDSAKVNNTGLATPPAQSPPPPAKADHATLPPSTIPAPPEAAATSQDKPESASLPEEKAVEPALASEEKAAEPVLASDQKPDEPVLASSEKSVVPSKPTESSLSVVPAAASVPVTPVASVAPAASAAPATPVAPAASQDQEMADTPVQSKVSREREDDQDEGEPATKRVKTDDNSQTHEFKVPELPVASSPQVNGSPAPAASTDLRPDGDDSITPPRLAQMKKIISNLKKSNASAAFRLPVDYVALKIPTYPEIIKHPMDLTTIDQKLKQNQYTRLSDFISDFELIVNNCITFNGKDHLITQSAYKMQSSFNNQMRNNMPQAALVELSKEEKKKAAKTKQEPTRQAPPRRPSVSTSQTTPGSARSPVTAPSTPFAPGPDGVPLIRRDSTIADGRPKRAIVPPKRNQEFAGGRPKKKKYELQLRFCQEVLKEISSTKHWQINQFFTHPVDPVALNIPTYFQVIKKPMDLETIQTKLTNNVYEKAKDFEEDVRLVFKNCYKFNPESDWVNQAGHQLEEMFDKKWAQKDEWIAAREPPSEPQSEDEDEDDAESDDGDSEAERNEKIAALQKQIEEMSKQMGELANKKSKKKSKSPAPKKSKAKSSKKEKPKTTFPGLQKSSEKKKSSSKSSKERHVTFQEKQYISNGIAMLPEKQMQEALKIIQQSVPSLANSAENEIELDIEEVPNHALIKLLAFVKRYAGPPPDEPKVDSDGYSAGGAVSKSKKNRPNKQEQEAQIEALRGQLGAYNGDASPGGLQQSIERGDSSDDGDSEESEEE